MRTALKVHSLAYTVLEPKARLSRVPITVYETGSRNHRVPLATEAHLPSPTTIHLLSICSKEYRDGSGYNRDARGEAPNLGRRSYQMKSSAARKLEQVPAGYLRVGVDPYKKRHVAVAMTEDLTVQGKFRLLTRGEVSKRR